jgi:hypothetical protein
MSGPSRYALSGLPDRQIFRGAGGDYRRRTTHHPDHAAPDFGSTFSGRRGRTRTHVTFKTERFNHTEVRPYFINDCCFGDDCALWLVRELRARGWRDLAEPWQEDWGWQTGGTREKRKYLLSVGLIPEDSPEWLVHVEESMSLLDRIRRSASPSVIPDLIWTIHEILSHAPDVGDIRWHYEDVFMRGTSTGMPEPSAPREATEREA